MSKHKNAPPRPISVGPMHRAILAALALVVVTAALPACSSDVDRGMKYCQENYFGYTRAECERQIRGESRR